MTFDNVCELWITRFCIPIYRIYPCTSRPSTASKSVQKIALDSYIDKRLRRPETVEVGCPRHPGANTIGNQLQDGDRTDGWPNLTTQP